jgi:hypothetical protein
VPLEVLTPLRRAELIGFLTGVFQLPQTAPFVDPALLDWKYEEPRPDWEGGRSYGWMDEGRIAAHAGLCPVEYAFKNQIIKGSYLIDWAAGRRPPGAGALLLRKVGSLIPVLLAIGGSENTQQVLPKLGYQVAGQLCFFARVMRPWRQFRTDPFPRGWKAPARVARNTLWSWAPIPSAPPGWTCSQIPAFDASHEALLTAETPFPSTRRTPALMNYLLQCPGAVMSAFVMHHKGDPRGWFVLARVGGVVRIADLRVASSSPEDWRAAYALATRAGLADPEGCELIAAASTPLAEGAIRHSGFRLGRADPVFLLDPKGLLLPHAPLEVSLVDSDAAYLYNPEYPYLV